MGLSKDIDELKAAGVISDETAEDIRAYYQEKEGFSTNRLFMIFGVLGAILVGLGIILIIAHNWDDLSRTVKTIFAFVPLIIGQLLCVYAQFIKKDSAVWKESTSAFLCLTVAASISLISQIYSIPGNLGDFLLVWMLLSIPLIYLMQASITSLICIVGITWYACETSYWHYPHANSYAYWVLMAFVLPHYLGLLKFRPSSNATLFHHWLVPLSFILVLGTLAGDQGSWMYLAYMSLFGIFYLIGKTKPFKNQATGRNGFKVIGVIGMIVLLLMFSFDSFWDSMIESFPEVSELMLALEFWTAMILTVAASVLLFKQSVKASDRDYMAWIYLIFAALFLMGFFTIVPLILINVLLFLLGIYKIREGNLRNHLGITNFGLLIIIALIICRFFDMDLSFVLRGLIFIAVGLGCFMANYRLLKRRAGS